MRSDDWYEIGGHDEPYCLYDEERFEAQAGYDPDWLPELDPPPAAELAELAGVCIGDTEDEPSEPWPS